MVQPIVDIKGLYKSFSTPVLKNVNLQILPGTIHSLVGENGAGKSTLINILNGLLPFDEGEIFFEGQQYKPQNMKSAMAHGFSLCAQELSLIENLSVAENILLKALPTKKRVLDHESLRQRSQECIAYIGLSEVKPKTLVSDLSLAQKQLVELAKALESDAKVLILDEPTAALTGPQADHLHEILRKRAEQGVAIIYVSHRLEDVLEISDTVSVLRDGVIQLTEPAKNLNTEKLIAEMSGKEPVGEQNNKSDEKRVLGEPCLFVENLQTADLPNPLSFVCHKGEIVGIAGLAGAGRSETLDAIYGLAPKTAGKVLLKHEGQVLEINSPSAAVKHGLGYVAEDRKTQGIFADKSIAINATIAGMQYIANSWGKLFKKKEYSQAAELIETLNVKCDSPSQAINRLSGGNQQKLLIARWMHCKVEMLLLDEPTRGVDVGSKFAIHDQLRKLREQGTSMLVVSSEIEELTSLCDRIIVLSERKIVASFERGEWSHDKILEAAFSEHTNARVA